MAKTPETPAEPRQAGEAPKIDWDDSNMRSTYANVCNATGTREEVVLFFGISNPTTTGGPVVRVQLSDRVILSPFAAKRMAQLLNNVVNAYEQRFGTLDGGAPAPAASGGTPPTTN